jgi:McbB family protein
VPKKLILPFQCVQPEPDVFLLITTVGVARLAAQAVYDVAERMHHLGWGHTLGSDACGEILANIPGEQQAPLLRYFEEIGALRTVHNDYDRYHAVKIISSSRLASQSLRDDLNYFTGIDCTIISADSLEIHENDFILVYTPEHDTELIEKVQHTAQRCENVAVLTAYLMARALIIDSLYIPAARTPCHFCELSSVARKHPARHGAPLNWVNAVTSLTSKPIHAGLQYEITDGDHQYAAALLRNRAREILGPHTGSISSSNILETCRFSLDGFEVQREVPPVAIDCEYCQLD